ncbi:MAG: MarR family transcriptional regulator [Chitinophagaceae bacterium]|nr:MarR family transcriptional regulator [Chitinophagaceae bacterium]
MLEKDVKQLRDFNRFYTSVLGVLNKRFNNDTYSLPELRVLQAIRFQDGIQARDIIQLLNIDKSYLSRILLKFEKTKLVNKTTSGEDRRSHCLHLTPAGKKEYAVQDADVRRQLSTMLAKLPAKKRKELISSMMRIKAILSPVAKS